MTATGARVSELLQIKAEHITAGHLDIYTKGGKIRRLYIPQILKNEAVVWLRSKGFRADIYFSIASVSA